LIAIYEHIAYPVLSRTTRLFRFLPPACYISQRHTTNGTEYDDTMGDGCMHNQWCGRSKASCRRDYQRLEEQPILLSLPTLSPALGFDPKDFLLLPSHEEAIDLEKAVHLPQPQTQIWSNEDVRTYSFSTCSSGPYLPKARPAQEPIGLILPRRWIRAVRLLRYRIFTVYRRLFTLVFLLNGIGIFILLRQHFQNTNEAISIDTLATLASSNFLLAILVRQDFIVNLLFRTAWLVPWNVPLRIRGMVARVYCYGGIHSGAAVAGTLWWVVFTIIMTWSFVQDRLYTFPILALTLGISLLLVIILLLAFPSMRARYHDAFEMTHRFLGWTSITLFLAQLLLLTHHTLTSPSHHQSIGSLLLHNPTFWNLTAITCLLIYPWLRLRRWIFTAHPLSSHTLQLSFPQKIHKFSCLSISSSPLREWHPFATFPSTDLDQPGTSMVISDAGDWTKSLIQHARARNAARNANVKPYRRNEKHSHQGLKMKFYVKSHPKAGVLSLSCLFPRVLIITTGSGIGPSLSSLLDRPCHQYARLVWSSRSPLLTYGANILSLVQQADSDAVVIDTTAMGRPDLLELAYKMYKKERMEAVFVLSNEKVVGWVVGGLEARGVPAFGPIWDS
jgi:hypothetical protein